MAFRYRLFAETDMALGALKSWTGLSLLNLRVQHSFICTLSDVANVAGRDGNFQRLLIQHIYRRNFMAGDTTLVRMHSAFVTECAGRCSPAPFHQNVSVRDAHCSRELGVEINAQGLYHGRELMTRGALVRCWLNIAFRRVTSKTGRVVRRRLECSFLEPEGVVR